MATVFTKIINGELPGRFVWSDERAVAFTSIGPITPGHTLVVPREEISEFTDAPPELFAHLGEVAQMIGQAQKLAWGSPRAALLIAGFEVPHLHLHVLPAWGEAELSFSNARSDIPGEEMDADAEKLRTALRSSGHGEHVPATLDRA